MNKGQVSKRAGRQSGHHKDDTLIASEMRYRRLFESAQDGLIIVDAGTGQVLDVNQFLIALLKIPHEQFLKKKIWELGPLKDIISSKNNFEQLRREKYIRYENLPLETADGRQIAVEFVSNVYTVGAKEIIQCNIRDLTDRKQHEEEKEKLQDQLLQSQKMEAIGSLAGGVAHDFNNLLTAIQGNTEMVMAGLKTGSPLYEYLQQTHDVTRRGADLTRQLLLFARRQTIQLEPRDLNKVITDFINLFQRTLGENIIIKSELKSALWTIPCDQSRIEQVLMNLAVNARDAMLQGGTLTIRTENIVLDDQYPKIHPQLQARPGQFVMLLVQDTGTGISPEAMEHLFEPFFTTKAQGKGTGLGLPVLHGIIQQHKGWINVYSEPGQGTCFKIYLPAAPDLKPVNKSKPDISIKPARGQGERILLVEDEPSVLDLACKILKQNGYQVFTAASMKKAERVFTAQAGNFDMLFSDTILPDGTGLDLIERFTRLKPQLRVLLSSGYTSDKVQTAIEQSKQYPFIPKPYGINELLYKIHEVIEKKA